MRGWNKCNPILARPYTTLMPEHRSYYQRYTAINRIPKLSSSHKCPYIMIYLPMWGNRWIDGGRNSRSNHPVCSNSSYRQSTIIHFNVLSVNGHSLWSTSAAAAEWEVDQGERPMSTPLLAAVRRLWNQFSTANWFPCTSTPSPVMLAQHHHFTDVWVL